MTQVLEMGLGPEDLAGMARKAKESLAMPGVAVEVPRAMVHRLERALQGVLAEQLLVLRDQERILPPDSFELRIR